MQSIVKILITQRIDRGITHGDHTSGHPDLSNK